MPLDKCSKAVKLLTDYESILIPVWVEMETIRSSYSNRNWSIGVQHLCLVIQISGCNVTQHCARFPKEVKKYFKHFIKNFLTKDFVLLESLENFSYQSAHFARLQKNAKRAHIPKYIFIS